MADFLQTLIVATTIGSLYALIALGYTMVYGILKLINFAHSDVVVLGAWSSLTAATFLLPRMGVNLDLPPWWAGIAVLLISTTICGLIGLAIERFAYKPIRRAPRLNALITAMAVSLLLQNVGQLQYTIVRGDKTISSGKVAGRDKDPKRVLLDQPITLAAGTHYLLHISAADGSPIERVVTADPGTYAAGQPIDMADAIGKRQSVDATFQLQSQSTSLKLPFGASPARMPNLMPTVIHAGDPIMANVLWEHDFVANVKDPTTGTISTITKPLKIEFTNVVIVSTAILLMLGLQLLVFHTRLGMAMRAVSFNTEYAALMGIPIDRVISFTFVLGAVLAAAAGFLFSQLFPAMQQTADYSWTLLGLKAFVAAVVGGIGNIRGAVLGGFLIAFIEQFGGTYGSVIWPNASAYTVVAVFALLIVVLLVKPTGLLGTSAREKV